MSKLNKKTPAYQMGEALGETLAPLIITGALMLLAFPFYLAYLWGSSRIKCNQALGESNGPRHFWLTSDEITRFKTVFQAAVDAKGDKANAIKLAETEGILKNNDGQYCVRSNTGRRIRETVNRSDKVLQDAGKVLTYLRNKPHNDWRIVDGFFRDACGAKWGLAVFSVASVALFLAWPSSPLESSGAFFVLWWGAASLLGTLAFFTAKAVPRTAIHHHFEEPPEVSLDNIDVWHRVSSIAQKP